MKKINNKGFTLIEIIVSLALISLVLVFFFGMFLQGTTGIISASNKNKSTYNAMDRMENVVAGSYATSEAVSLTIQLPSGTITQPGQKITKTSSDYNGKTSEVTTFIPDADLVEFPVLVFSTTSPLPDAKKKTAYSTTIVASGGSGGYRYTATGLPTWLTIGEFSGILSGTAPNTPGDKSTFNITVTDSEGNSKELAFDLTIK
jgi:prepilin-type N-terminal cleavage/methylation domain-containing protein